jgi:hypothetical protein
MSIWQEHPGHLHFATDAWTSPNHRAFVAWTVHFEYEGSMMSFLLDIIEVPESHSGATLAHAFQTMLERFGLENKVSLIHARLCYHLFLSQMHAFTGDNVTSNDTQTAELEKKRNSFDTSNHVRCFNHTIQLSAKSLLKPFASCISSNPSTDNDKW